MRQRNYCLATWDAQHWRKTGDHVIESFAFIALRDSKEEAQVLADQLGLRVHRWMKRGQWAVGHDVTVAPGLKIFDEIQDLLRFLSMEGIDFDWSPDLIPEMPLELSGVNNTFERLEEALLSAAELKVSELEQAG